MITPGQKAQLIAEAGYTPELLQTNRSIVSFLKMDAQCAADEHALNIAHLLFVAHPAFKLYNHRPLEVVADTFTPEYVDDILFINRVMSADLFDEKLMQNTGQNIEHNNVLSLPGKRVLLACIADEFHGLLNSNPYSNPAEAVTHIASRMVLVDSFEADAHDLKRTVDNFAVDAYAKYTPEWGNKLSSKHIFFNLAAANLIHQFETDLKDIAPGENSIGKSLGRVDLVHFVEKPDMENTYPWVDEGETYLPHRLNQILQASLLAGQAIEPTQAGFLLRALVIRANRRNLTEHKTCDALVGTLIDYVCDMARPQEFQNIFYPRGEIDHAEYYYYSKSISETLQNKVLDRLCIEEQIAYKSLPRAPFNSANPDNNRQRG